MGKGTLEVPTAHGEGPLQRTDPEGVDGSALHDLSEDMSTVGFTHG